MFGNMEEQQKMLKKKLAEIKVHSEAGDGAVKVTANANREILNISIDKSIIDPEDAEQLEDLLLVAINRAIENASEKEAEAAQNLLKDMLPPGLGDIGNLFQ